MVDGRDPPLHILKSGLLICISSMFSLSNRKRIYTHALTISLSLNYRDNKRISSEQKENNF